MAVKNGATCGCLQDSKAFWAVQIVFEDVRHATHKQSSDTSESHEGQTDEIHLFVFYRHSLSTAITINAIGLPLKSGVGPSNNLIRSTEGN